jgi:hypothetical protein
MVYNKYDMDVWAEAPVYGKGVVGRGVFSQNLTKATNALFNSRTMFSA